MRPSRLVEGGGEDSALWFDVLIQHHSSKVRDMASQINFTIKHFGLRAGHRSGFEVLLCHRMNGRIELYII